jgi:hypothetical protein
MAIDYANSALAGLFYFVKQAFPIVMRLSSDEGRASDPLRNR